VELLLARGVGASIMPLVANSSLLNLPENMFFQIAPVLIAKCDLFVDRVAALGLIRLMEETKSPIEFASLVLDLFESQKTPPYLNQGHTPVLWNLFEIVAERAQTPEIHEILLSLFYETVLRNSSTRFASGKFDLIALTRMVLNIADADLCTKRPRFINICDLVCNQVENALLFVSETDPSTQFCLTLICCSLGKSLHAPNG
jgi:glycyl-tRNA synthetase beta subunit